MKKTAVILVFVAILIFPLHKISAQTIPSSFRSRNAIARVRPNLEEELNIAELQWGRPIYLRIFKEEQELEVWVKGHETFRLFKTYTICTYGYGALGPKTRQGDGQAPEGFYYVAPHRLNPVSNFHLSFDLGYPNKFDRSHNRTGTNLMVHGSCVSIGCYAMTDERIEEIYALADAALRNGQPYFRVHVFPFRMTTQNIETHRESEWFSFWENLKEGYGFFERNGNTPPNVEVNHGCYVFELP